MAASFASRLSGLKKINQPEDESGQLRLTLPPDASQKSTYQPSSTFSNTRTSFRLLKGRIDRGQSTQKQEVASNNIVTQSKGLSSTQKLSLIQQPKTQMKLYLNIDNQIQDKKLTLEPPKMPQQKRILIAKEPPKQEPKKEQPPKREQIKKIEQKEELPQQKIEKRQSQQFLNTHQQKPIRQQEAEQSLPPESQNDLILCPEGCGRKFNRKALQKHAKACKLVFMSKRKQFNSEAKRITSKEQATLVKQTKLKEKKEMGMTRGKGFDKTKTGQNWKAASEDFRAAIKAIKKQQKDEDQQEQVDQLQQKKVITVQCEYCQKQYNQVFIDKHKENCAKKKQKQREKQKKKTGKK